jgi:hypothetical protein
LLQVIQADGRSGRFSRRADAAAVALGRIGKSAEAAIPLLIDMLTSGSARGSAEALGRFG